MIRILITTVVSLSFLIIGNGSIAEEKKDCSQYSTKTLSGLGKKMRCKKGLPQLEKNFFDSLNLNTFKKKTSKEIKGNNLRCDEYTSKTIAGLIGKLRCRKQ